MPVSTGFLSLACGYVGSDPFTDYNGITWQSDGNAVSGGSPFNGNGKLNGKAAPQLQALRFFPDGLKNCYNLQLRNPGGVYLVRAGFLYGNYDEAMQPPDFGVSLGATIWVDSVKLDSGSDGSFYEAILAATSPSIAVCLLKGSVGNPFINSLELRPLPANSYSITTASQVYLYPVKRVNFGGPSLRYERTTRAIKPSSPPATTVPICIACRQVSNGGRIGRFWNGASHFPRHALRFGC